MGAGPAAWLAHRQAGGRGRLRAGGAGGRPAAEPGRAPGHRLREGGPRGRAAPLRDPGLQDGEAPARTPPRPARGGGHRLRVQPRDRPDHLRRGVAPPLRRRDALRRCRARARCPHARTLPARRPPGDGLPDPAEPQGHRRGRPAGGRHLGRRSQGRDHRGRGHRRRLPRQRPPRGLCVGRGPLRLPGAATDAARRQSLARVAAGAPDLPGPRGGGAAPVRGDGDRVPGDRARRDHRDGGVRGPACRRPQGVHPAAGQRRPDAGRPGPARHRLRRGGRRVPRREPRRPPHRLGGDRGGCRLLRRTRCLRERRCHPGSLAHRLGDRGGAPGSGRLRPLPGGPPQELFRQRARAAAIGARRTVSPISQRSTDAAALRPSAMAQATRL